MLSSLSKRKTRKIRKGTRRSDVRQDAKEVVTVIYAFIRALTDPFRTIALAIVVVVIVLLTSAGCVIGHVLKKK
jgi:hypothetical protein